MRKSLCYGLGVLGLTFAMSGGLQAQDWDQIESGQQYNQPGQQQQFRTQQDQWQQDYGYQQGFRGQQQFQRPQGPQFEQFGQQQQQQPAGLGVSLSQRTDQGVLVTRVHPQSPAEQAGLQPGDQIISFDGQRINSPGQLISMVQQQQPGNQVQLRVIRDGQQQNLQARLESRQEALARQGRGMQQQRFAMQQPGQQQFMQPGQQQQFRSPMGDQQLVSQVNRLERLVQILANEVDDLRAQIDQDRAAGYRGQMDMQQQRQFDSQQQQGGQQQLQFERQQPDQQQQSRQQQQREQQRDQGGSENE